MCSNVYFRAQRSCFQWQIQLRIVLCNMVVTLVIQWSTVFVIFQTSKKGVKRLKYARPEGKTNITEIYPHLTAGMSVKIKFKHIFRW